MEIEIDYTKSAQNNAQDYFRKSKEAKKKLEGAEEAIKRLEKKVTELEKSKTIEKKIMKKEEREWYEKFYWFFTSDGMLAIGGRSAQQNEEVVSKYMDRDDLFFHANVFGASAVILKSGKSATKEAKEEAAQFAACFSKAWESGNAAVDVFAAGKEQISKSSQSGYLGTGSFLISGEREWFKNVRLELCAAVLPVEPDAQLAKFQTIPAETSLIIKPEKAIKLMPGKMKKSDTAAKLSKALGYPNIDYIMQHLPPGNFNIQDM